MAKDLTTSSRDRLLPAVDVADPATMLLLPAWLASQIAEVSDLGGGRTVVDTTTGQITKRVATIPLSKMPTGPQRAAIERRITELRRADRPGPETEILSHVGDLILEYATARMDDRQVAAKASAYLDVLSTVPAWAVREAITRWRCGPEGVDEQTLDFAPRPHRLKAMAERIALVARGQAMRLQRILDAEPEEPLTEAQMAENAARMAEVLADLAEPSAKETPAGTNAGVRASALRDLASLEVKAKASEDAA